jgi:polysaccharide deacetylase family protein (PEP-CTERM system associated)
LIPDVGTESRPRYVLSVDVEDYFQVEAFSTQIQRADWHGMPSRVVANTERVLDLLAEFGQVATFFVVGWVAERYPELVRRIYAAGHEIACHSYWHKLVYTLKEPEFREDTRVSKAVLESAVGKAIYGYRAPSYSVTAKSMWALDVLAELGFTYDSSIFPIVHDISGIPDYPRVPHRHPCRNGGFITEFPATTIRFGGLNWPVGGGGYLRIFPMQYSLWGLKRLGQEPGVIPIVYFHPWELDPQQPRIKGGLRSRLRHYTSLSQMEGKLRVMLSTFRFARFTDLCSRQWVSQTGPSVTSVGSSSVSCKS